MYVIEKRDDETWREYVIDVCQGWMNEDEAGIVAVTFDTYAGEMSEADAAWMVLEEQSLLDEIESEEPGPDLEEAA